VRASKKVLFRIIETPEPLEETGKERKKESEEGTCSFILKITPLAY
jgi:hypothetical protein